jgi:hypothetical protein
MNTTSSNPYIYPIIVVGSLEVLSILTIYILRPDADNAVIMGGVTLAWSSVFQFIISQANAANIANVANHVKEVGSQVAVVQDRIETQAEATKESVITSRAGLAALIKSDDLVELDRLADAFTKNTLTLSETKRFLSLLRLRLQDDLTMSQITACERAIEISEVALMDPDLADKQHVPVSDHEAQVSKNAQAHYEKAQKENGERNK